jgi:NAD(P)-dependent dehydrogenase (short-subunit alcohol dehydrogenase family)
MSKMLVAGASGLIGLATVRHVATLPGWDVVGVSRRVPIKSTVSVPPLRMVP